MILKGSCTDCGSPLASDQRYCVNCGKRVSAFGLPYAYASTAASAAKSGASKLVPPIPPRMATTFGALAIGFGFVIGTAISPTADQLLAGSVGPTPPAPPAPAAEARAEMGDSTASEAAPISTGTASPTGTTPTGSSSPDSSGGGKKKKKKKMPTTFTGTVVHNNSNAASFTLASSNSLLEIHSATPPAPGAVVSVPVRNAANRTYIQQGQIKNVGQVTEATFVGLVTYSDPANPDYAVSAPGTSVLVHTSAGATLPTLGQSVTVTVQIGPAGVAGTNPGANPPVPPPPPPPPAPTPPCDADGSALPATPAVATASVLTQTTVTVDPVAIASAELEGIVQASCPATGELVLSADDIRESLTDLVLSVTPGVDVTAFTPGLSIKGTVGIDATTGALTLTGIRNDTGIGGADDTTLTQGDQRLSLSPRQEEHLRAKKRLDEVKRIFDLFY